MIKIPGAHPTAHIDETAVFIMNNNIEGDE
jgi:hypothetical protein